MSSNTYSEEELKKVLKNLFAEKKRVKELQKKLEQLSSGYPEDKDAALTKKFYTKLDDIHKISIVEDYAKLKAAYVEKEKQLEKVKPVLTKLVKQVKEGQSKIEALENASPQDNEEILEKLTQSESEMTALQNQILDLEKEKQELQLSQDEHPEIALLQEDVLRLEQEIENFQKQLEAERAVFEKDKLGALETHRSLVTDLDKIRERAQQEQSRSATEKQNLIEKMADLLSQVQNHTEIISSLREEGSSQRREMEQVDEQRKNAQLQVDELKTQLSRSALESTQISSSIEKQLLEEQREKQTLLRHYQKLQDKTDADQKQIEQIESEVLALKRVKKELEIINAQLQETDIAAVREENQELRAQQQSEHETILQKQRNDAEKIFSEINQELGSSRKEKERVTEECMQWQKKCDEMATHFQTQEHELHSKAESLSARLVELEQQKEQQQKRIGVLEEISQMAEKHGAEKDSEIYKAQQHLAKKVKETTLLRDLVDRQKLQIDDLQNEHNRFRVENERLVNSLNLQKEHEQKLHSMAAERTQSAESLAKEWQEKYLELHQQWQEMKGHMVEHRKLKKNYEQMSLAFANMKNFLNQAPEPTTLETQEPYEEA